MKWDMMRGTLAPLAQIAEIGGESPCQNARTLMTEKRRALVSLLSVISGKTAKEVLGREACENIRELLTWLADDGEPYVRVLHNCGAELVCTVLYEYRPDDVPALCFLLRRKRKEDIRVHYIADALRLLVLSKLEKGSKYPALQEFLEPRKAEQEKTGEEIMNNIFDAALGKKGDRK